MTKNQILRYLIDNPSKSDRDSLFEKLFEKSKEISKYDGGDSFKLFIDLPECPTHIQEYYVQYCAEWLCEDNRWDRRGTTGYVNSIKKLNDKLSDEMIDKLIKSLNEFGETIHTKPLISYFNRLIKKQTI